MVWFLNVYSVDTMCTAFIIDDVDNDIQTRPLRAVAVYRIWHELFSRNGLTFWLENPTSRQSSCSCSVTYLAISAHACDTGIRWIFASRRNCSTILRCCCKLLAIRSIWAVSESPVFWRKENKQINTSTIFFCSVGVHYVFIWYWPKAMHNSYVLHEFHAKHSSFSQTMNLKLHLAHKKGHADVSVSWISWRIEMCKRTLSRTIVYAYYWKLKYANCNLFMTIDFRRCETYDYYIVKKRFCKIKSKSKNMRPIQFSNI